MSATPKCNRVWNKQEKQIIRLLYRKGFISPKNMKKYYWASFKRSGKLHRPKGKRSGRKFDGYLDEVHYYTVDYWGEVDEHPVVDGIINWLIIEGLPEDLSQVDWQNVLEISSFQYKGRKWFIKYLKALPTVRHDSRINKILRIKVY